MIPIDVDDEVHRAIYTAACTGDANQRLRHLLHLPHDPCPDTGVSTQGELAGLVAAGLIALGEQVYATGPVPVATVAEHGWLRAADAAVYPGPRQLVRGLRGGTFAPYGWQVLTAADGTGLETLVSATSPKPPRTWSHPAQARSPR